MIVLSVESSCDETSVSVTKDGKEVLSNVVLSQIDIHQAFGGVVPEIASREHVKGITVTLDQALKEANIKATDVDLVAVTKGPGLIGSLLTGINAAKAFAFVHELPLVGVHHIAGHIYANQVDHEMVFPLICLVVSGGHTELWLMRNHFDFLKLGETQDDAIGEAYDKVARVLGLGYPGGPIIDQLAKKGRNTIPMPKVTTKGEYDFSYSGLKSHVINTLNTMKMKQEEVKSEDFARSFQDAAVEILIEKSVKAVRDYNAKMFMIAGGVAANSYLRERVSKVFKDIALAIPQLDYCTDNAAMIGIAGYYQYKYLGSKDTLDFKGDSKLKL